MEEGSHQVWAMQEQLRGPLETSLSPYPLILSTERYPLLRLRSAPDPSFPPTALQCLALS